MLVVVFFIHDLIELVVVYTSYCDTLVTETQLDALEYNKYIVFILLEVAAKKCFTNLLRR